MLVLAEEELLSMPSVAQCFPSDSMKPEKPKKRPSKAKLAKRQKSTSKTSLASSDKILSAAEVSADVPATPLIWSTTGLTDNDSVEGNAAMSSDQTGRSDLATQTTRGDTGRSDTTFHTAARHRRRRTRHRERHGPRRECKTSSEQESPPQDRRPKRVQVTHAVEDDPRSTDTGERSTQLRSFDLKLQAESSVRATEKDLGGRVVTSVRRSKQGVTRFQQISAPLGGERREAAIVRRAAPAAMKAKHSVADAARSQIDVNRAGNTVAEGAAVGVHCSQCKTLSPTTKLSVCSPTLEGHANVGSSSGSPPMTKGDTPPCNPCFQQRSSTAPRASTADAWQSRRQGGIARPSESALVDVSEEDYYGDLYPDLSPDMSTRTGVTAAQFYGTTTSSVESKQCRSMGQSWISQVARDMNGGTTPHKSTVMALLKKGMAKKSPAEVVSKLGSPSISWESEHTYEPVATESHRLLNRTQPQGKAANSGGQSKGDDEANAVRPTEITSEESYVAPSLTFNRESKGMQVTRFAPRNSVSRVSVSRPSVSNVSVGRPCVNKVSVGRPSVSKVSVSTSRVSRASTSGPDFKQILFPVSTIAVLILLAFAIAFLAPVKHSRSKTTLVDQLAAACAGDQACVRAVKVMTGSLDLAADPCLEFDRFVCGNWRAFDPHRHSYHRERVRNYTRSIGEALLRVIPYGPDSPRSRGMDESSDVTNMATLYSTCQAFAEEHNTARVTTVSDVVNAMYLDHGTSDGNATARTNLQRLLQFAVSSSFKNGLPTIVSVILKGDKTFLDVGETLRSTLGPSLIVEDFLRETLGSLGSADDNETVGVLFSVDSNASDWRSRVSTSEPFNRTRLTHLHTSFPSANWAEALNQGLARNASEYSPDSVVYARGMAEVSEIMTMFSEDNLAEHACAYASAVLVAQVMKYKYLFRGQGAYNHTTAPEGADLCLEVTGTYFKDLLPRWVTTVLVSNHRMQAFKNMMESLQHTTARRSLHSKSMIINGSEFSKLNFIITGERSLPGRRQPASVTSPSSRYADQFLLNVVLASRDHVGVEYDEGAVERQLSGNLSFFIVDKRQFVAVPANFLDADSLVAYKNVPSIDYASVGVRILLEWLEWTFHVENASAHPVVKAPEQRIRSACSRRPVVIGSDADRRESPLFGDRALNEYATVAEGHVSHGGGHANNPVAGSLDERIRCIRDVASELLGRSVGPEEGRLLAFVDWAVEVASTAAEEQSREVNDIGDSGAPQKETDFADHDSAELRISRQFFYLSFCHTLCGEDGLLAGACRYRTRRSRDFARAFRCAEPPNYPSC